MTPDNDKISSIQLGVFIYNIILGVGILTLPSSLTKAVESDAWIVSIFAGLANIAFVYLMCRVGVKYSQYGFVGTLRKLFGKIPGTLMALPVFIYFVSFAGLEVRIFAETIKVFLLNNTPLEFVIIPLLVLAIFLARSGVEPTARFFEAVTPAVIFISVIIVLVAVPSSKGLSNLRPILAQNPAKYFKALTTGIFAYGGFEILLVLFPFLKEPKKAFKYSVAALVSIAILYTIIVIECLSMFGSKETQSLIYPTMTMIKSVEVPGAFVERLEGLLLALWVLFVFTTVVALIYGFSVIGGDILNHRKRKHIISIFLPPMYIIALTGDNVAQLFKLIDTATLYLGGYTALALPIIMNVASLFKREKEDSKDSKDRKQDDRRNEKGKQNNKQIYKEDEEQKEDSGNTEDNDENEEDNNDSSQKQGGEGSEE